MFMTDVYMIYGTQADSVALPAKMPDAVSASVSDEDDLPGQQMQQDIIEVFEESDDQSEQLTLSEWVESLKQSEYYDLIKRSAVAAIPCFIILSIIMSSIFQNDSSSADRKANASRSGVSQAADKQTTGYVSESASGWVQTSATNLVTAAATAQAIPVITNAAVVPVSGTTGDGYMFRLDAVGSYDYWIATVSEIGSGDSDWYRFNCDSRSLISGVYITGGSALSEVRVSVIPYFNNGVAGNPATASWKETVSAPAIQFDQNGVAIPTSYPGYAPYYQPMSGYCTVSSCYVYNVADKDSEKKYANMLYKNDDVMIYGEYNGYYYISTDSGNGYDYFGYVKTGNLKIGTSPYSGNKNYNATRGVVTADSANLRSSPSKENNNNIICAVKKGTEFTVHSFDGYWYYISYSGGSGYLSYKMVSVS